MFGEMKLRVVSLFKMAHNGMGICAVRPSEVLNKSTALNWRIAYIPCYVPFYSEDEQIKILSHIR